MKKIKRFPVAAGLICHGAVYNPEQERVLLEAIELKKEAGVTPFPLKTYIHSLGDQTRNQFFRIVTPNSTRDRFAEFDRKNPSATLNKALPVD